MFTKIATGNKDEDVCAPTIVIEENAYLFDKDKALKEINSCLKIQKDATSQEWQEQRVLDVLRHLVMRQLIEDEGMYSHQQQGSKHTVIFLTDLYIEHPLRFALQNMPYIRHTLKSLLSSIGFSLKSLYDKDSPLLFGRQTYGQNALGFIDSLSSKDVPLFVYGLWYKYQVQQAYTNKGILYKKASIHENNTFPFMTREDIKYSITVGGDVIEGIAHDGLISTFGNRVIRARFWEARCDCGVFSTRDTEYNFSDFMALKMRCDNITQTYYEDELALGEEACKWSILQEYFFVSLSIQDMLRSLCRKTSQNGAITLQLGDIAETIRICLNSTRCALVPIELLRVLLDIYGYPWDDAYNLVRSLVTISQRTEVYDPTISDLAHETLDVQLLNKYMPRHLELIYEINKRLLERVVFIFNNDQNAICRVSLVQENAPQFHNTHDKSRKAIKLYQLMAETAGLVIVLTNNMEYNTNSILNYLTRLDSKKYVSIAPGIAHRLLYQRNTQLAKMVTLLMNNTLPQPLNNHAWLSKFQTIKELCPLSEREDVVKEFVTYKAKAKQELFNSLNTIFDLCLNDSETLIITTISGYTEKERDLLTILYIIKCYINVDKLCHPLLFVFGTSQCQYSSYSRTIIQLIYTLSLLINSNKRCTNRLTVVFLSDSYNSLLLKCTDVGLSMDFYLYNRYNESLDDLNPVPFRCAMMGIPLIASLNSLVLQIYEDIGEDNIFTFGASQEESIYVLNQIALGSRVNLSGPLYAVLAEALKLFSTHEKVISILQPLVEGENLICYDFDSFAECCDAVIQQYGSPIEWHKKCIKSIARSSGLTEDRFVDELLAVWSE